jgi:hypothetical protein
MTLKDHVLIAEQMVKALNCPPRSIGHENPVRRRRRKPSMSRALRDVAKAGLPIARIELGDGGTSLVLGEPLAAAAAENPWDAEIVRLEARRRRR